MSTELVPAPQAGALRRVSEDDFMPLLGAQKAIARKQALNQIIADVLIKDVDYGVQPGSANDQKVLKKSGAEKLCSVFGLSPRISREEIVEDWTGEHHGGEPFFYYKYVISLYRGDLFLGEANGSCNSWETKYRWRWVTEAEAKERPDFAKLVKRGGRRKIFEPDFALDKMETTGRYGKPKEYWDNVRAAIESNQAKRLKKQLGKREFFGWEIEIDDTLVRIPNPNPADVVNTVQKMAYKRALVAPVLVVTNCSDAFTQDIDEEESGQEEIQFTGGPAGPEPPPSDEPGSPQAAPRKSETKPAEKPSPTPPTAAPHSEPPSSPGLTRPIPEELQIMFAAVRRDPRKELKPSYDVLWDAFQRRGQDAMRAYDAVNEKFRQRHPKGTTSTIDEHLNNMLDLWDALQKFPEKEPHDATAAQGD